MSRPTAQRPAWLATRLIVMCGTLHVTVDLHLSRPPGITALWGYTVQDVEGNYLAQGWVDSVQKAKRAAWAAAVKLNSAAAKGREQSLVHEVPTRCPRPCSECDGGHHRILHNDRCKHCDVVLPEEGADVHV